MHRTARTPLLLVALLPAGCKKEPPPPATDAGTAAKASVPADAGAPEEPGATTPADPNRIPSGPLPAAAGDAGKKADAGPPPLIPELGPGPGRLMRGWEGLRSGMKSEDLVKTRPRARASDVSGVVWSEAPKGPWSVVTYRFHPRDGHLVEVRWIASERAAGEAVFRSVVGQATNRWRIRPVTGREGSQRVTTWKGPDGELRLRMDVATERLRLEWDVPPPPPPPGETAAPSGATSAEGTAEGSGE